jgi:hypothetical protein
VTFLPDRQSSDDIAAARRLTARDVASAWSLTLFGLVALAAFSFADLACPSGQARLVADSAGAPGRPEASSCPSANIDVPAPP